MKKKILITLGFLVVIAAIVSLVYAAIVLNKKEDEVDSHFIELSIDELEEKINNKDSFILVISQTTCSHCAEYKPILKQVLADYDLTAYYIEEDKLNDTEKGRLKAIANTSGTPQTIFIEDGAEVSTSSRMSGTQQRSKIISRFKAMGYISEDEE